MSPGGYQGQRLTDKYSAGIPLAFVYTLRHRTVAIPCNDWPSFFWLDPDSTSGEPSGSSSESEHQLGVPEVSTHTCISTSSHDRTTMGTAVLSVPHIPRMIDAVMSLLMPGPSMI